MRMRAAIVAPVLVVSALAHADSASTDSHGDLRQAAGAGEGSDPEPESTEPRPGCLEALDELGVDYERARRRGIRLGVQVNGALQGIEFRAYKAGVPLVLDCSLVYSLARSGELLARHGIEVVRYSSAYDRRNIRGTRRPSRHSFGLAIDVHTFRTADGEVYTIKDDYEQGLGDNLDCIGEALTEAGQHLRAIDCLLTRSELYRVVLSPDFDADHYNHFHLEALPWDERTDPIRPTPSER